MNFKVYKEAVLKERKEGMSFGNIAKKYGMSKSSVQYIVENYNKECKKRGPKEKLNKSDKRRIQTIISEFKKDNMKCSTQDIIKELNLEVSKSTVCRSLKCLNFNYKRLPFKFTLTPRMRQKRVDAARNFLKTGIPWNKVIFSDEKLFTIHGCDSFYSWLNKNQSRMRVRQVVRSPGLMVWGMIMPNGLLSYEILKGKQKSKNYIDMLENKAFPIIKVNHRPDFIFQQDNCPIHVSRFSKEFFKNSNIEVLDWPPYSPDLNIIENIWSTLSRDIYSHGAIKNLRELESRIKSSVCMFNETKAQEVHNLYDSMTTRLCLILEKRGQRLKY